ncbi:MAG TPA: NAD synthetase [Armatimonadetes bacterium]|jgi:NAD(P) transhydrogenase subunit beta|nr:NAD synthetase [Armatimonadota bacterium]
MIGDTPINAGYLVASALFIIGLKMLSRQQTARRGNMVSAVGMLLAVIMALLNSGLDYRYIIIGLLIGAVVGAVAALRVALTSMPEMVALFNGFGGLASLLVGWAEYEKTRSLWADEPASAGLMMLIGTALAVLIGGVTFSGSLVAWGKLSQKLPGRPILFPGQQVLNLLIALCALGLAVAFIVDPAGMHVPFLVLVGLSLLLGVLITIPIGGADMPVVISLLNSYSGLAGCAAGFVISNTVLIVSGSLVGASGIILTTIMCKAMNRSLSNVLFGGFGATGGSKGTAAEGEAKAIDTEGAYYVLEAANSVVIVPGYGMAVAQAQHAVRELAQLLEGNGAQVSFGIHPVAGRMPGHMNVLLAEANVPYEQLQEMDDVNAQMDNCDVAIVIGANDVVNPAARDDATSPIYGMPIVEVDRARAVFVLKRSMASGFAGIPNPLFFNENTRMLFGDAKASIEALVAEFKEA